MSKDFWNLPVNPVWRVPGFMKGGKADNERSNPVLLPLVPEFTNICISHLQFPHFQKFLLEVVAIVRKNAGWESDTPPLPIATASQKQLHSFCALFALSCPPLGKEEWGGGNSVGEGRGVNWKCEMMMMGDDDEMNNFLHSLHNGILRARG